MGRHLKRILLPPFAVAACWSIFAYGGVIRSHGPKWDYVSVLCFAALVVGLLFVPCATLAHLIYWLRAPACDKSISRSSFLGWALASAFLFGGFAIVPWSRGWP